MRRYFPDCDQRRRANADDDKPRRTRGKRAVAANRKIAERVLDESGLVPNVIEIDVGEAGLFAQPRSESQGTDP